MFLDNVTNRTIEISLGRIYDYKKAYSEYLVLRAEIRAQQLSVQKNQEKQIAQTEKLIEKFRAKASKASMAQSLIKKLDRIERVEVDEEDNATMTLNFPISQQPGKIILEANNLSKSYGDKQVLKDIDFLIERGSKIAFVGQNGQGKSTLAKIFVDEITYDGEFKLGHNVTLGYFAQNQAEYLDGNITILETMENAANDTNRAKVRDMLGAFLFRGDDVDKKVKVLSGGERNRLALCKMLLDPFNVLVMDEPTNHLDIKSKNVLKAALQKFEGTLIIVSHDRDFLQGLTASVLEFRDFKTKEYLGDIDYYLEERKVEDFRAVEKKSANVVQEKSKISQKLDYDTQKKLKQLKNKLSKIETQISDTETKIATMDKEMAEDYEATVAKADFFDTYQGHKHTLEKLMEEWEEISLRIESI
jgi:ATP-binding cassette subfamily F protein 3